MSDTVNEFAKRQSQAKNPMRILHIEVPEKVFNGAKAAALLQNVKWPEFIVDLLRQAGPPQSPVPTVRE